MNWTIYAVQFLPHISTFLQFKVSSWLMLQVPMHPNASPRQISSIQRKIYLKKRGKYYKYLFKTLLPTNNSSYSGRQLSWMVFGIGISLTSKARVFKNWNKFYFVCLLATFSFISLELIRSVIAIYKTVLYPIVGLINWFAWFFIWTSYKSFFNSLGWKMLKLHKQTVIPR